MVSPVYLPDAAVPTLVEQIRQLPRSENEIVLLLVGEHSTFDLNELIAALNQHHVSFAGGVFTGVIFGNQRYEAGVVADVLPIAAQPSLYHGLDTTSFQIESVPDLSHDHQYTALVLVDGLTSHIALFLERLFRQLHNQVHYIGGGAGSLSFQQKPCLFDNQGVYQDAALVLWLQTTSSLGVRHGWQHLRGPLIATKTDGTIIQRLNGRPAFELYSQIIERKTGETLTKENFFSIAKQYPLGIFHHGMDYIVRDPITFTDDKEIVCVGEVPKGSMVYILQGNKQNLVSHARQATSEAMNDVANSHHNLIFDCISRVLYLEDDFSQELDAVRMSLPDQAPAPFGVLSLGEIASFETGRVEFFNKTFVVGALQNIP
ncbi:MAG: FIST C-terminal domain-containing protein [Anaerolineae bacterium]|nr:FIST C-terminal domain-containing protein [Anaerolineae bacterium]